MMNPNFGRGGLVYLVLLELDHIMAQMWEAAVPVVGIYAHDC